MNKCQEKLFKDLTADFNAQFDHCRYTVNDFARAFERIGNNVVSGQLDGVHENIGNMNTIVQIFMDNVRAIIISADNVIGSQREEIEKMHKAMVAQSEAFDEREKDSDNLLVSAVELENLFRSAVWPAPTPELTESGSFHEDDPIEVVPELPPELSGVVDLLKETFGDNVVVMGLTPDSAID